MRDIIETTIRIVFFICIVAVIFMLSGCIKKSYDESMESVETIEKIEDANLDVELASAYVYPLNDQIAMCIDPRVELLYLASDYLIDEPMNYFVDKSYLLEAREIFEITKEDEFFKLLNRLLNQGFKYGQLTNALNLFNSNHKLNDELELSNYSLQQLSNLEVEKNLFWLMKKYRESSTFDGFFSSYEAMYKKLLKLAEQRISTVNVIERVEAFFGQPLENITIALTPFSNNGYSTTHVLINGKYNTLITMPAYDSDIEFIYTLIHELSHRFVNIETRRYPLLVSKSEWRYKPLASPQLDEIYYSWETIYNEYMVRAIACLIIGNIYGEGEMQKRIDMEVVDGFSDIKVAIKLINAYLGNRNKYHSFEDYSEILMEQFSEIN